MPHNAHDTVPTLISVHALHAHRRELACRAAAPAGDDADATAAQDDRLVLGGLDAQAPHATSHVGVDELDVAGLILDHLADLIRPSALTHVL